LGSQVASCAIAGWTAATAKAVTAKAVDASAVDAKSARRSRNLGRKAPTIIPPSPAISA
jgi:hypothetical protein